MGKKQSTIHTLEELRTWIETKPHHITEWREESRKMILENHHEKIIVPGDLWEQAPLRPGGEFDKRMWRWGKKPPEPVLWVTPEVITSTLVFPVQRCNMASKLQGYENCLIPLFRGE